MSVDVSVSSKGKNTQKNTTIYKQTWKTFSMVSLLSVNDPLEK